MTTVGVRELKNRLSSYLRRVKQGEEVSVTERGMVIARLVPVERPGIPAEFFSLIQTGLAAWKGGKPAGSAHPVKGRGKSLSRMVTEDRR